MLLRSLNINLIIFVIMYALSIVRRLAAAKIFLSSEKRIRTGIQCLIWIPLVFLALLFLTESEKVIFLLLWVVSLFIISGYLIYIEYIDFRAQERLHRFNRLIMTQRTDYRVPDCQ